MRKSLSRLVRSFGDGAESYDSAESYLSAAPDHAPDCLLLDVHMPGLSGFELQSQLRSHGDETPVVFITAHATDANRDTALEGGAIALLAKPFGGVELKSSLERGFSGKPKIGREPDR